MTEPFQAEKTDEDIAQHCAYFLPAVALTLGPDNWVFLRKAYKYLALDYQVSSFLDLYKFFNLYVLIWLKNFFWSPVESEKNRGFKHLRISIYIR